MRVVKAQEQHAKALLKEEKYAEALQEYQILLSGDPSNPNFHNSVGDIHKVMGATKEAIEAYKDAREAYTNDLLYNNAVAICKKILRIDPNEEETYYILGTLYAQLELSSEAFENFLEYSNRMRRKNKVKGVIKAYEFMNEKFPENESIANELRELYLESGIEQAKGFGPFEKEAETADKKEVISEHLETGILEKHLGKAIALIKGEKIPEEVEVIPKKLDQEFVFKVVHEKPRKSIDSLTHLYDRDALMKVCEEEIVNAEQDEQTLGIVFLDIAHFKNINEEFGEPVGDKILCQVADLLKNNLSNKESLFRYNGDAFAILSPGLKEDDKVSKERAIKTLVETFEFDPKIPLNVNTGSSVYPGEAGNYKVLLNQTYNKLAVKQYVSLHSSQIIERDAPLDELQKLFTEGNKVVTISGDICSGKTRFIMELSERLKFKGAQIFVSHCNVPVSPYGPFKQFFRQYLEKEKELPTEVSALFNQIVPLLPFWKGYKKVKSDFTDYDMFLHYSGDFSKSTLPIPYELSKIYREKFFDKVLSLLSVISSKSPLLIVIEDLHFADEATQELLVYISKNLQTFKGLICCTLLDGEKERFKKLSGSSINIRLENLSDKGVDNFISMIGEFKGSVVTEAKKVSRGNPFMLEEALKNLSRQEEAPVSVREALESRLIMLDKGEQAMFSIAAVYGNEFDSNFLGLFTGKNEGYISNIVDKGLELEFIESLGNSRYRFTHEGVRKLFESLIENERELQKKMGEWMEIYYSERMDEFLWDIAYHFEKSDDKLKSASYNVWAGDEAQIIYGYRDAANYYIKAIELTNDKNELINTYNNIIISYLLMEDYGGCEKIISNLKGKNKDKEWLAMEAFNRGLLSISRGDKNGAFTNLAEANKIYKEIGDKNLLIESCLMLGELSRGRSDYEVALRYLEEALKVSEEAKREKSKGKSIFLMGCIFHELGKEQEAFECYSRAMPIFKKTGSKLYLLKSVIDLLNLPGEVKLSIRKGKDNIEV